jgi:septal ring factor EnvC (AmiA/AmiB activator)
LRSGITIQTSEQSARAHHSGALADCSMEDAMAEETGLMSRLKDFMTFLREGIITVVLLLFLVLPGAMKGVLTRAGFTSADIAGFKLDLQQSAQQTQAASDTVAQLEERLTALNTRLDQVSQSPSAAPETKQIITSVASELSKTREQTNAAQKTLQSSLRVQRSVIQQVDPKLLEQIRPAPPQR